MDEKLVYFSFNEKEELVDVNFFNSLELEEYKLSHPELTVTEDETDEIEDYLTLLDEDSLIDDEDI